VNSKRRCLHCREYQYQKSMLKLPAGSFCSIEHAIKYSQLKGQTARIKYQKEQSAKVKLNDIRHQHKLTQTIVNRLCLLLDKGKPCISCGKPDQGGRLRNAGHFKSRGANSVLCYDLKNIHGQCTQCNLYQSGNIEGYRQGLLERYGSAIVDYLDTSPRSKAWTGVELSVLRSEIAQEVRSIQAGNPPSKDWRSV
jgi:hypothetical protein